MFNGSKKGNRRANEVAASFAFERFDVGDEVRETIFNPKIAARAAEWVCIRSLLRTGNVQRAIDRLQRRFVRTLLAELDAIQRDPINAALSRQILERPVAGFAPAPNSLASCRWHPVSVAAVRP